jgi:hypothetical protein
MDDTVSRGSVWRRWEPHIHAPGTVFNDQYPAGESSWDDFIKKLESTDPAVEAIGITDYYRLDGYKRLVALKREGRLPNVGLIFPNVEIRLGIGTSKDGSLNAHLLFSPDDSGHVAQVESILAKLTFQALDESFSCTRHDLIALGRRHKGATLDEDAAFAAGANQFKVDFQQLKTLWKGSAWLADNCLLAIAAGESDGSSGVREEDGSLEVLRKDIERFADIIFSSQKSQIDFWIGNKAATREDLERDWDGPKPCLHGSDAHSLPRVAAPDQNRFCWVKGDLTFEALRYVCMEPASRVHIGPTRPDVASGSRTIAAVSVAKAPWMTPSAVPLNPGLVAVIGARGSGKTALADLIAAGGYSAGSQLNDSSFLVRANEHLADAHVDLAWVDGDSTGNDLRAACADDLVETPRVQYLSQQFVDKLCSSDGAAVPLVQEIHRVLFGAHSVAEREGANDFDELLEIRLAPPREELHDAQTILDEAMTALAAERQLKGELPQLQKQRLEQAKAIEQDEKERKRLVGKGQEERVTRYQAVQEALDARRRALEKAQEQSRALKALAQDVERFRATQAPGLLSNLKQTRASAGLSDAEWDVFKVVFAGDVDSLVKGKGQIVDATVKAIAGAAPAVNLDQNPTEALIPQGVNLLDQSVALLTAESERLARLIGVDRQNAKRIVALNDKIARAKKALEGLDARIKKATTASERIEQLVVRRRECYVSVFRALANIEAVYRGLYGPLHSSLEKEHGATKKLGILVRRIVNVEAWATRGEELLDLRKQGPFRGRGVLLEKARASLLPAWERATPEEIGAAMQAFARENEGGLKDHRPDGADARQWTADVGRWLHDTSHVSVSYTLTYDGIDIERLSPGTRGVVLLLLYLTVDQEDDRPLVIDQPEENLDPKSVYDELVDRFRLARERRQVIIVTHNANLVVNTDADQVIVASATAHMAGRLPAISYVAGGLENIDIRRQVCDVLEGGERAFRERAKRLRLKFSGLPK